MMFRYISIIGKSVMGCHGNHAFSHSPSWVIYGDFCCIQGFPGNNYGTNSKLSLECKVDQIRSWGSRFEAEISLVIMFVYAFTLFIRLSLIILNMQMK